VGHIVNADREYHLLQRRLDRTLTGAPASPTFIKILELLFTAEEAQLARRIPDQPISLGALSRKTGIPQDELGDKMTEMGQRGLVVDMEYGGRRLVFLAPVVIGFFEFTFMRARDDLPMAELARLFEEYMGGDGRFAHSIFQGQTQIGRSLIHEEALPDDDYTEILDWERASQIVKSASAVGVSLCACRHKASHLGKACDRPVEVCMTLNYGATSMIRNGIAREISNSEGMRVLEQSKEAGLAQTGDNVQRKMTYICNCCGCCCGMMQGIRDFGIRNAIVSSNWIMEVDLSKCTGCGKCAKACPVDAIHIEQEAQAASPDDGEPAPQAGVDAAAPDKGEEAAASGRKKKRKWAVRDETTCLGCGVCYSACEFDAIRMAPRAQRVITPETVFDQRVMMAIERGKLANLIFDTPERLSHRALARMIWVLEKSPPFKAAMAVKPLRSAFLNTLVKSAKRMSGKMSEAIS